jgi:DNA-binding NarL/FixJ family response regulator
VEPSTIQVLVVDDFAPWRRFVRSMLRKWTELRLVGEVSDGLAAVQKAQELQPDLILMDLGLPTLNGIEAARRIRKLSVNSKILIASTNCDLDIIEEAFRSGISGYVLKSAASTQLFPAVEAVIQGKRFLCPCLCRHDVTHPLLRFW